MLLTVICTSAVLFALLSVIVKVVLPAATGLIVTVSPLIFAVATSSFIPLKVKSPKFVPVISTCASFPPSYNCTDVGFALIFTFNTVNIASCVVIVVVCPLCSCVISQ